MRSWRRLSGGDLLLQHVAHAVGIAHALADLRPAGKPGKVRYRRSSPRRRQSMWRLSCRSCRSSARLPSSVDRRPCGRGSRYDEHHARLGGAVSFRLTVVRRSSSMMPIFTVFAGRPRTASTAPKISLAKATSSGPCIFGFTMNGPGCRIAAGLEVGKRGGDGHKGVHDAFRNVASVGKPDCRVGNQMTTLRTSIRARAFRLAALPSAAV